MLSNIYPFSFAFQNMLTYLGFGSPEYVDPFS